MEKWWILSKKSANFNEISGEYELFWWLSNSRILFRLILIAILKQFLDALEFKHFRVDLYHNRRRSNKSCFRLETYSGPFGIIRNRSKTFKSIWTRKRNVILHRTLDNLLIFIDLKLWKCPFSHKNVGF